MLKTKHIFVWLHNTTDALQKLAQNINPEFQELKPLLLLEVMEKPL